MLYLNHPAALGINAILMWLGLEATPALGFTDFRNKSALGDYELIVTDSVKIRRIRDVSRASVINVDDFIFREPAVGLFRRKQRRFDASAFISRVQYVLDMPSESRRRSPDRDRGVISFRPSRPSAEQHECLLAARNI
ncbi:hypothetical protein HB780_00815 (plasmid) [Rhizobium lusitanum]|uniref:hypothetical protein n=1 Tax=Rhizobium lusitanum TaxID=293958 RepID=UPI00160D7B8B|nr:hypothetical protein [Rhizobium lusitanum]QND44384.1 hypothetical protein HB780_00815 [Rhizobium lusitanum]